MEKLFSEFPGTTPQQWKEQIIKDLKGTTFEQLISRNSGGMDIHPFYTSEDLKETPQPLFTHSDWDICETIEVNDAKEANRQALRALEGGASGLVFYIPKKTDTATLIKGISLEHIYSSFLISNDALHVLDDLKKYYGKVNAHEGRMKCFVDIDPICMYAYWGEWHSNEEKDLSVLKKLKHITVNVNLYGEAGAHTVNELAFALAHTNEYFNYLEENKELKNKTLHFQFSVGADFFNEIAKFRAFRKLIALLQKQYNTDFPIHLHAQTAQLNKSSIDAYTNMLRTTTEGMSAAIGGCNSIGVLPYNFRFEKPVEFSSRMARNQQHILKEESYLNKVADMASGSYYVETLTEQIASRAWEEFKTIESKGGFLKCLQTNFIQDLIENDAKLLLEQVKEGKIVLVGVNKFQDKSEVKSQKSKAEKESSRQKAEGSKQGIEAKEIKRIIPMRLAEEFENKLSQNSELKTPN